MTAEPPDDLTIPRPGSTSARRLLSAGLQPLLAELGRKSAQASEPARALSLIHISEPTRPY